jgi:hypothetical protein
MRHTPCPQVGGCGGGWTPRRGGAGSGCRAILGIGVGEREGNEPYGVEWTKPVARFEEAVATWCGGYACGAAFFAALATRRA